MKFATAAPRGVKRSSGSSVEVADDGDDGVACHAARSRRPGRACVSGRRTLVRSTASLRLSWRSSSLTVAGLGGQVDDGVDALGLLVDLVRQPAAAPDVDLLHRAAVRADDVEELVERRGDGALLEVGVEDDHEFVVTHADNPPPLDSAATVSPRQEVLTWPRQIGSPRGRTSATTGTRPIGAVPQGTQPGGTAPRAVPRRRRKLSGEVTTLGPMLIGAHVDQADPRRGGRARGRPRAVLPRRPAGLEEAPGAPEAARAARGGRLAIVRPRAVRDQRRHDQQPDPDPVAASCSAARRRRGGGRRQRADRARRARQREDDPAVGVDNWRKTFEPADEGGFRCRC